MQQLPVISFNLKAIFPDSFFILLPCPIPHIPERFLSGFQFITPLSRPLPHISKRIRRGLRIVPCGNIWVCMSHNLLYHTNINPFVFKMHAQGFAHLMRIICALHPCALSYGFKRPIEPPGGHLNIWCSGAWKHIWVFFSP